MVKVCWAVVNTPFADTRVVNNDDAGWLARKVRAAADALVKRLIIEFP